MKQKLFLAIISMCFVTFFSSCKKNDAAPPPSPTEGKLKAITGNPGTASEQSQNYSYDNRGRLTLVTRSNGEKVEYSYEPTKVTNKYTAANGIITTTVYELGPNGYITKDSSFGYTSLYDINNDGFIQRITRTAGGTTSEQRYYYHGNNILDSLRASFNGVWNLTVVYSHYSTDRQYPGGAINGLAFTGQMFKHPFGKTVTRFIQGNGNIGTSTSYKFNEYDDKGRLVKVISESQNGIQSVEIYTYY